MRSLYRRGGIVPGEGQMGSVIIVMRYQPQTEAELDTTLKTALADLYRDDLQCNRRSWGLLAEWLFGNAYSNERRMNDLN